MSEYTNEHPKAELTVYKGIGSGWYWQAWVRNGKLGSRVCGFLRCEKTFRTPEGARSAGVRDLERMHFVITSGKVLA